VLLDDDDDDDSCDDDSLKLVVTDWKYFGRYDNNDGVTK
jgi:hypothetical protein